MTGGSDYHAKNKPQIQIDTGKDNNYILKKNLLKIG